MPNSNPRTAMFPGTFDPVTYGHLDIIERSARLYDKLIVAVGNNPLKNEIFTPEERREMLAQHTSKLANVDVRINPGLTVEFAVQVGAGVIIRGIRGSSDLHAELQIATTNRIIGQIETVFLLTSSEHILTSSTLIKQIVEIGRYDSEHLSRLVPMDVAKRLQERLRDSENNHG